MNATMRLGAPADAAALKQIDSVVPGDPTRADFIDRWLCEDTVLVAELAGQVVGYGVYNHDFFHQGQVDMLMVDAEHRGGRIGEQLLSALERLCDTPKLFVTTNLSNHRMQRLLLRMGYDACGYIGELDPGDPELMFVKKMKPVPAAPRARIR
jgi:GNAT superfamily N-acetyltransferase